VVGVLATITMFVVNYSRTNVVKHSLSVANYRSRVTRPAYQREILNANGDQARILQLQGFLFFGTAQELLEQTRQWVAEPHAERPRYLLLDFTRVTGLDTTALLSFSKAKQLAEASRLILCLAGLSPAIHQQLAAGGFLESNSPVCVFNVIDQALEWVEEQVLRDCGCPALTVSPLLDQLMDLHVDETTAEALISYLERLDLPAGTVFIRRGEPGDTMYFVESGQVTAQIRRDDGSTLRLETMMNGRVVGEMGFYMERERSADVVAEAPSVVYRLTRDGEARMEAEHPEAAVALHRLIVRMLSERVHHLVTTVDALQK
jgi:SulP family sulfate permease